jgi:hypothetical protein
LPGQFGGLAGIGEYLLGSRQEDGARGSEFHHATVAIEELHAELALEQGDLLAQGRLNNVLPLRGAAEVQFLGKHDE